VAALLRFWSLVTVFSSRRLRDLLHARGFALLAPAGAVAARMRMNAHWGFNPNKVMAALAHAHASRRPAAESHADVLAA
jgi:hypothetical protein